MALDLRGGAQAIGNTPVVPLCTLSPTGTTLWGKCEFLNPSGSVKDRTALGCLQHGLASGELKAGQKVVEMTSGNMGAGLAMLSATLGYEFTAFMSEGSSPQRAQQMRAYGADVRLVPQVTGRPGAVTGEDVTRAAKEAAAWALAETAYFVDQFNNPGCASIHKTTTGVEIVRDIPGRIYAFVAALGTGGTFMGVASALKEIDPGTQCLTVHPGVLADGASDSGDTQHIVQGTGYGFVSPHFNHGLVDGEIFVSDDEVLRCHNRLMREEGLYVGYSSAANVCAALKFCEAAPADTPSRHVVTILCDTGFKYGI